MWVEKNPVPPANRQALDWSVVLTVGWLCPIVPSRQYSVKQQAQQPQFNWAMPGLARVWNCL